MISREILKSQINTIGDEHLTLPYEILKSFETAPSATEYSPPDEKTEKSNWRKFLEKYSGCMADAPIRRAPQGNMNSGRISFEIHARHQYLHLFLKQAIGLSSSSKAYLAESLLESLDVEDDFSVSDEDMKEIRQRCDEIDNGLVELIDGETAIAQI